MDQNAGYVATAYVLTGGVLIAYTSWLVARLRRAERSVLDGPDRVSR